MLVNKVVFIISSYIDRNTGIGGHFRSLKTISNQLELNYDVKIYSFGSLKSPVLSDLPYYQHFQCDLYIKKIISDDLKEKIASQDSVIKFICLDLKSLLVSEVAGFYGSGKVILLKAGGAVFKPISILNYLNIIVFNDDDSRSLILSDPNRNIFLAPNRIENLVKLNNYKCGIGNDVADTKKRILLISRISEDKKKSIEIVYESLKNLAEKIIFIHVGVIQSNELYHKLKFLFPEASIKTTADCVNDASQSLFFTDFVCGIGRSALEGVSLKKPTFIPLLINEKPTLVMITPENWLIFRQSNFTHRINIFDLIHTGFVSFDDYLNNAEYYNAKLSGNFKLWMRDYSEKNILSVWDPILNSKINSIRKLPLRVYIYLFIKENVRKYSPKFIYSTLTALF
jgi:hypothetical protein